MPGSAQNPLHVTGANYESKLCKGGAECFFDLATINKTFDEAYNEGVKVLIEGHEFLSWRVLNLEDLILI